MYSLVCSSQSIQMASVGYQEDALLIKNVLVNAQKVLDEMYKKIEEDCTKIDKLSERISLVFQTGSSAEKVSLIAELIAAQNKIIELKKNTKEYLTKLQIISKQVFCASESTQKFKETLKIQLEKVKRQEEGFLRLQEKSQPGSQVNGLAAVIVNFEEEQRMLVETEILNKENLTRLEELSNQVIFSSLQNRDCKGFIEEKFAFAQQMLEKEEGVDLDTLTWLEELGKQS